ncbi:GNAT family N-acetyltransferase [Cellulosilyticum sp. I15G10I2]|uniref:GNAT family N-acetyltransferase n=1 Tax=Cellulosilyticum sp. I15G10I2 TaxID=1892843 RepID=UPI00085C10F8|nr:GNAT family protein [Cellulosilyticum sp. I15G10I2]
MPIYNQQDTLCGYLVPVIKAYRIVMPVCGKLLARWRNENPSMSADQFTATSQGTEKWLDELIIQRDDRILFLIVTVDGEKVGHIGYSSFNYEEQSCEVDAVLRGEKSVHPGMMTFALGALTSWGLKDLKLLIIRLRVFSDNTRAVAFYKRNNFYIEAENHPVGQGSSKTYTVMRLQSDS